MFIVIEGIDGSGKTEQIKLLKKYYENKNVKTLLTRDPGATAVGEKIRAIVLGNDTKNLCYEAEALLYAASRAQMVNEIIKPALEKNIVVLCDRYVDSSIVYQGIGRDLGINGVKMINDFGTNDLKPDYKYFLDIPSHVSIERRKNEEDDRIEKEGQAFFEKTRLGYLEVAKKESIKVIDGTKTILEIHEEIVKDIEGR